MSTFSQRLTALAAVITALLAGCILLLTWGFISAFSESLDATDEMVVEVACTDYAAEVLDLRAEGYTAKQITDTFAAARGHEDSSYLFEACGDPGQIVTTAGPPKNE